MKHLLKLKLQMKKVIFLLAVGITVSMNLQAQKKLGYVNSQELLQMMPEAKKADSVLKAYMTGMDEQYKLMMAEGQKKLADYQANEKTWSEIVKETKEKEITDLQSRLQEFQGSAEDKIQAKRSDIFKPLLEKAQKAIQDVGEEGGYDYVFDGSQLLFVKESENITTKVKTKLGIK